jgi:VanZ family protein
MWLNYGLAIGWMVALYVGTALIAGKDPRPPGGLELVIFEARHILTHTIVYAIQAWLLARTAIHDRPEDLRRSLPLWLAMATLIGVGQEVLQNALREVIRFWPSVFDVAVDAIGAAVGLWLFAARSRKTRVSRKMPAGSARQEVEL